MKRTPYCEILQEYGGKFVDFAGFEMPVQFEGILHEHKAVRENVGLFDVSHMGENNVEGKGRAGYNTASFHKRLHYVEKRSRQVFADA